MSWSLTLGAFSHSSAESGEILCAHRKIQISRGGTKSDTIFDITKLSLVEIFNFNIADAPSELRLKNYFPCTVRSIFC